MHHLIKVINCIVPRIDSHQCLIVHQYHYIYQALHMSSVTEMEARREVASDNIWGSI